MLLQILVVGYFHQDPSPLAKSNLLCVCGDECISADLVQAGVYRSFVSPHKPGLVDLYLSFDGQNPISQVVTFEYHCVTEKLMNLSENKLKEEFQYQMRLSHLLFSASNRLTILSSKPGRNALKEAKIFIHKTCQISDNWTSLVKSINSSNFSYLRAKDSLFEITLQNRLHEWLLDRIVEGSEISVRDDQGLGVIHYCAILGYTWAVYPFSLSGLSLDYRDKYGWTALHWASSYGRYKVILPIICTVCLFHIFSHSTYVLLCNGLTLNFFLVLCASISVSIEYYSSKFILLFIFGPNYATLRYAASG